MSSPGSGKTTTLTRLIALLKEDLKVGVMEADIDSDADAKTIAATDAKAIQLHTGGMCHLDAAMTVRGWKDRTPAMLIGSFRRTWAICCAPRSSTPEP